MIARVLLCSLLGPLLCAGCAHADDASVAASIKGARDLRGAYRAALCSRQDMAGDACAAALRTYPGEVPAPRPEPAVASRYRLLFVPGFLASCFPRVRTFADVVEAARSAGFAAEIVPAAGRNGIDANARIVAAAVERVPDDGKRLVLIGHSKGANDILQMLATRPDLAPRVSAVLTIAGALQGSAVADDLHFLYPYTFGAIPFPACETGDGDAVLDLQTAMRGQWWKASASKVSTPLYSIVAVPALDRLSPGVVPTFALLSRFTTDNDGLLRAADQVAPASRVLGVVNADHLGVAIPHPGWLWVLVFNATPFPRSQMVLAAIDVIASDTP